MIGDGDDNLFPDDEEELSIAETPTISVAEPAAVRKQKRAKESQKLEAQEFWRQVFASPVGRREMWGILKECHPFDTRYGVGPSGFPNDKASDACMAEQQLGLRFFMSWQVMDFDGVSLMVREHDPRFINKRK